MTPFRTALADRLDCPPLTVPPITALRGIVIVAGGDLYSRLAFHLITALRGLGCRLPVELWHFSHEMTDGIRQVFAGEPGVQLVDVGAFCRERGIATRAVAGRSAQHSGWWLKSFALAHSGFAEVMLLDADNLPAAEPT